MKIALRKIDYLLIRSFAGPLLMTFFIALFVLLMQFLWKYVDDLVGKGLEWYVILQLLFYASATFVPMALPLAILLSSLMTFGNLGENYELVAMKTAGISIRKVMKPLVIVSFLLSVFAFYFSNNVLPLANLKFKSLLYDIKQKKLALDIQEGVFYNGLENFVIKIGEKDEDEKTIRNVMIFDHTAGKGNVNVTIADSGRMELTPDGSYLIFTLYNGKNFQDLVSQEGYQKTRPFQRTAFRENFRKFNLSEFELVRTNEDLFRNNYTMLNFKQLKTVEDSLVRDFRRKKNDYSRNLISTFQSLSKKSSDTASPKKVIPPGTEELLAKISAGEKTEALNRAINKCRTDRDLFRRFQADTKGWLLTIFKHQVEWHRKFTLSAACFIMFFIGAPLGAIIRKGGLGFPAVISILFFVLLYILSISGEKSVKTGVMDANLGMWMASIILMPLGIFLTYKAATDSAILDPDFWLKTGRFFLFRKHRSS